MIYTCMKKRKTIRTLTQMREREKETEEEEKERERGWQRPVDRCGREWIWPRRVFPPVSRGFPIFPGRNVGRGGSQSADNSQ